MSESRDDTGATAGSTKVSDAAVQELLSQPNYAVISTHNADGTITSSVIWQDSDGETVSVNSAVGRKWPTNLDRDPQVTLLVQEAGNPYHFVEIRGTAAGTEDGADAHIDALTKKYLGQDSYPFRQPGEVRKTYVITAQKVRLVKQ